MTLNTQGTERSLLVGTVDRDEDEEFPDDESDNDVFIDVCYFIVGGDDGVKTTFDLHPLRHELIAVKVSISLTFYAKLLRAQIPKGQKDTENLTESLRFWDLGA